MRALLFSGGLDSTALAYWLRPDWALTIDYGQRAARGELRAATQISEELNIRHATISAPIASLGAGDLSRNDAITSDRASDWWPCRNQQLLSLAAPWALKHGVDTLLMGSIATDERHGDGTADFYAAINALFAVQGIAVRVEAPALAMTKADLLRTSQVPLSILAMSHSCHTGEFACGYCRACNAHRSAMEALGFGSF